jgi:hypothetical protein
VRNNPLRYTDPTGHYILLEEDFGVRITAEGVIQIVQGGHRFANPVEVALANAILSGDPRHLAAIPADAHPWAIERSLAHVLAELGYRGGGPGVADLLLDPALAFGLGFGMVKAIEGGDVFPAEGLPAGERLAYTETARDAAAYIRQLEAGVPRAHAWSKHGPTAEADAALRAAAARRPGRPQTRFITAAEMASAIEQTLITNMADIQAKASSGFKKFAYTGPLVNYTGYIQQGGQVVPIQGQAPARVVIWFDGSGGWGLLTAYPEAK